MSKRSAANGDTLRRLVRSPDPERAATTMNHISEHEWDCITKADAIEAAVWAANERDAIRNEAMARFADIGLAALTALKQ